MPLGDAWSKALASSPYPRNVGEMWSAAGAPRARRRQQRAALNAHGRSGERWGEWSLQSLRRGDALAQSALPPLSTTQTEVSSSTTFNPTYCSIAFISVFPPQSDQPQISVATGGGGRHNSIVKLSVSDRRCRITSPILSAIEAYGVHTFCLCIATCESVGSSIL